MILQVNVTQEDINRGKICMPMNCPVALAVTRAVPNKEVVVSSFKVTTHTDDPNDIEIAELPEEATAFILAFDNKKSVTPFSFTVEFGPRKA